MLNQTFRHLSVTVAALCVGAASLLAAPTVGQPAPDFSAKSIEGKPVKLADLKGKVVVLEWYNPACPFVKKFYAPGKMQALQKSLADKGVVWLSIASTNAKNRDFLDNAALVKRVADDKSAPFAVVDDAAGDLARLYEAKTTPHIFVIGKDGKLVYQGAIDSIRSSKSEDIAKADAYLVNAVEAALAGKPASPAETKAYGCGVKL